MVFSWEDSRRAFADAAQWFVRTTALVGDRWNRPGLGEWDVRALVGHPSRPLLTRPPPPPTGAFPCGGSTPPSPVLPRPPSSLRQWTTSVRRGRPPPTPRSRR